MEHIFKVSMFTPSEMSSQKYIQPKKTPRAINPIPLTEELFPEQPMPSVQKGKPNIQTQQLTPNISISLSIYLCVGTFIMSPCHRIIGVCWSRGCPKRLVFFTLLQSRGWNPRHHEFLWLLTWNQRLCFVVSFPLWFAVIDIYGGKPRTSICVLLSECLLNEWGPKRDWKRRRSVGRHFNIRWVI